MVLLTTPINPMTWYLFRRTLQRQVCNTLRQTTNQAEGSGGRLERTSPWKTTGPIRARAPLHEALSGAGPLAFLECQIVGGVAPPMGPRLAPTLSAAKPSWQRA